MNGPAETSTQSRPIAGFFSFAMGALGLMLVLVHFWAGPFAPQQRASITVGEIAADIRQAAVRKLTGKPQPKPAPVVWDSDRILKLVAALLAGIAVVAGVASLARRETWRPAAGGIALGASAVALQFFTWAILVVAGAIVLAAIIQNITGILGE